MDNLTNATGHPGIDPAPCITLRQVVQELSPSCPRPTLFHLLEYPDVDYEINVDEINERWADGDNVDVWSQVENADPLCKRWVKGIKAQFASTPVGTGSPVPTPPPTPSTKSL